MTPDNLARVIMLLFGKMDHGGPFWCYVAIKPSQFEAFKAAQAAGQLDLHDFDTFGEVVVSAEGETPPLSVTEKVAEMYGADPDTFFKPIDPLAEIDKKLEQMREMGEEMLETPRAERPPPDPSSWAARVSRRPK